MGYNAAKREMKKAILFMIILGFIISVNANNNSFSMYRHSIQNTEESDDSTTVSIEILSVSSDMVEILVKASDAAYELCNYFSGSWLDAGLTLYCAFGGDVYTCTAYKVVQAACAVNGAIRLSLQGDISGTLKQLLYTSAKLYAVSKSASKFYITPAN